MGKRRVLLAGVTVLVGATGVGGMAIANDGDTRLRADLLGTNEVRGPNDDPAVDPDARGRARVQIDTTTGEVCFRIRIDDTGTPNRGHIHVGAAGVNGGIVVPLFELAAMPADERHDALERGRLEGCVTADPAVLAAIAADPDGYYVNLHNARFPGGAARGQLG